MVAVHDHGVHLGVPFLVMELVEGQSLEAALAGGPLEPAAAARLLEQVARTLAAVHARGVVHRDVKPSNILLAGDGVPRLVDFGLARRDEDERLTRTGELVGTPLFMAPEQVLGQPVDARADISALGVVAYQAVTGHLPVAARTFAELIGRFTAGSPAPPPSRWRALPPGWDDVCSRALALDPASRHPTADALADDLRLLHTGGRVSTPAARRRRRVKLVALAVAALLAAAWTTSLARARRLLADLREWDGAACALAPDTCAGGAHRLVAFDLGLGGPVPPVGPGVGPVAEQEPLTLDELDRWLTALDARDGALLPAGDRAALGRARARLLLHRRLLEHQAGRHEACLRPAPGGSPATRPAWPSSSRRPTRRAP